MEWDDTGLGITVSNKPSWWLDIYTHCNPCVPLPQTTGVGPQQNQLLLEISEPAVQDKPGLMWSDLYLFQRLLNSSNIDLLCFYDAGKHPKWLAYRFLTRTSSGNKCTHFLLTENFQVSPSNAWMPYGVTFPKLSTTILRIYRTSLVAQWLRICLPT